MALKIAAYTQRAPRTYVGQSGSGAPSDMVTPAWTAPPIPLNEMNGVTKTLTDELTKELNGGGTLPATVPPQFEADLVKVMKTSWGYGGYTTSMASATTWADVLATLQTAATAGDITRIVVGGTLTDWIAAKASAPTITPPAGLPADSGEKSAFWALVAGSRTLPASGANPAGWDDDSAGDLGGGCNDNSEIPKPLGDRVCTAVGNLAGVYTATWADTHDDIVAQMAKEGITLTDGNADWATWATAAKPLAEAALVPTLPDPTALKPGSTYVAPTAPPPYVRAIPKGPADFYLDTSVGTAGTNNIWKADGPGTGWSAAAVAELLPDDMFHDILKNDTYLGT